MSDAVIHGRTVRVLRTGPLDASEVWVVFGALGASGPSCESWLAERGALGLHVIPNGPHWYQDVSDLLSVSRRLKALRGDRRCVALGGSMGGFAALAYSQALEPDVIIVGAPQVALNTPDPRWAEFWSGPLERPDARPFILNAPTHVLYDPRYRWDRFHAEMLRNHAHLIPLPFAGHEVFAALSASGTRRACLAAMTVNDDAALAHALAEHRRKRRSAWGFHYAMAHALLDRGSFAPAAEMFDRAHLANPTNPEPAFFGAIAKRALLGQAA